MNGVIEANDGAPAVGLTEDSQNDNDSQINKANALIATRTREIYVAT